MPLRDDKDALPESAKAEYERIFGAKPEGWPNKRESAEQTEPR